MLRVFLLLLFFSPFIYAQNPISSQSPSQTSSSSSSAITTSVAVVSTTTTPLASTSASTTLASTSTQTQPTTTATAAPTTIQQGPVAQPPTTTGTPGGPTPYTYVTVINGVTTSVADIFTPTSPPTVSVTPTVTGTILNYSSWLSVYGPTHSSSSAGPVSPLCPIPFSFIFVMLLGMLGGGGMLYV